MTRKKYTEEVKAQIIKEAIETCNAALVARRHNIHSSIVNRWVKEHNHGKKPVPGKEALARIAAGTTTIDTEVRTLSTDNEKLKKLLGEKELEIEILRDLVKKVHPHLTIK